MSLPPHPSVIGWACVNLFIANPFIFLLLFLSTGFTMVKLYVMFDAVFLCPDKRAGTYGTRFMLIFNYVPVMLWTRCNYYWFQSEIKLVTHCYMRRLFWSIISRFLGDPGAAKCVYPSANSFFWEFGKWKLKILVNFNFLFCWKLKTTLATHLSEFIFHFFIKMKINIFRFLF